MKLKPTTVSGALIVVIAGYVGYRTVYRSSAQELGALRAQLAEQQKTQALRMQLAGSLQESEQFRKRLSPEADTERLVHEVSRLAEQLGVQLTAIVPEGSKRFQEFTSLPVTLQFVSSYHQLGKFLSALEHDPLFIRIDEFDVSRNGQGTAQVRLTVSTFYVPSTAPVPPGGVAGSPK